jgi:hypothetical protein
LKTGVKLCPLYQNKRYPALEGINEEPTTPSRQKTWFSATTVVKCGYPIESVPIAAIIKAVKLSLLKIKLSYES